MKDLTNAVSGILNSKPTETTEKRTAEPQRQAKTHRGRPHKDSTEPTGNYQRFTFIADVEQVRKLKVVSAMDGLLIKDVIATALNTYFEEWEQKHGKIKYNK